MSSEAEVSVFVNSVLHYFETTVQRDAACGTLHLALRRDPELSDYTGIVTGSAASATAWCGSPRPGACCA